MQLSSTADDDKKRERRGQKLLYIFLSLSRAHPILLFPLGQFTSLDQMGIYYPFLSILGRPLFCNAAKSFFFFFPRLHGMNFHNNGNRSVGFYRFIRTSHKKKKIPQHFILREFCFPSRTSKSIINEWRQLQLAQPTGYWWSLFFFFLKLCTATRFAIRTGCWMLLLDTRTLPKISQGEQTIIISKSSF